MIQWLSDFGDQSVILPTIGVTALVLAASREFGMAALWVVCTGGVLAAMVVLKLAFSACALPYGMPWLQSPSGHTASATAVYTLLVGILAPAISSLAVIGIGLVIALGIAATRVALDDHTIAETVVGAAVGLAGIAVFLLARPPRPARRGATLWPLMAICLLAVVLAHGHRMQAERQIRDFASTWLRARLCARPASGLGAQPPTHGTAELSDHAGGEAGMF